MTGPVTRYVTALGDSANRGAGGFKMEVLFTQGSYSFVEPPVGMPLALRFYDATSLAAANYFNAVTDTSGSFNWKSPGDPLATAWLALRALSFPNWQGGNSSAYRTTIPIPEPNSTTLLVLLGCGALAERRRSR